MAAIPVTVQLPTLQATHASGGVGLLWLVRMLLVNLLVVGGFKVAEYEVLWRRCRSGGR